MRSHPSLVLAILALLSTLALVDALRGLGMAALATGGLAVLAFGAAALFAGAAVAAILGLATFGALLVATRTFGLSRAWAYLRALD